MAEAFVLNGKAIAPGQQDTVEIALSRLSDHTRMKLMVKVIHGRRPGPVMFVSGALHGDEIIGVEIIRRLARLKLLRRLRGTLLLVPVVNTYGFISLSRYLPDRRDLNRCFPGSASGSLASQLAHTFMTEIVSRCDYGIDLHSGAIHRANLPQIRATLDKPEVQQLARAFGTSIILDANLRDGSLRQAAQDVDCDILLYEAGEALRFDEVAIRVGMRGIINVLRHVGMLTASKRQRHRQEPVVSRSSHWLRAPTGGLMRTQRTLGNRVQKDEILAWVGDPLGSEHAEVTAKASGIIIGQSNLPVVNRGDALFHIAQVDCLEAATESYEALTQETENDPLLDGFEPESGVTE
ncbi:MAG: M14 family metallopeptidase [Wenzhouxiangellaceae bacterium]